MPSNTSLSPVAPGLGVSSNKTCFPRAGVLWGLSISRPRRLPRPLQGWGGGGVGGLPLRGLHLPEAHPAPLYMGQLPCTVPPGGGHPTRGSVWTHPRPSQLCERVAGPRGCRMPALGDPGDPGLSHPTPATAPPWASTLTVLTPRLVSGGCPGVGASFPFWLHMPSGQPCRWRRAAAASAPGHTPHL